MSINNNPEPIAYNYCRPNKQEWPQPHGACSPACPSPLSPSSSSLPQHQWRWLEHRRSPGRHSTTTSPTAAAASSSRPPHTPPPRSSRRSSNDSDERSGSAYPRWPWRPPTPWRRFGRWRRPTAAGWWVRASSMRCEARPSSMTLPCVDGRATACPVRCHSTCDPTTSLTGDTHDTTQHNTTQHSTRSPCRPTASAGPSSWRSATSSPSSSSRTTRRAARSAPPGPSSSRAASPTPVRGYWLAGVEKPCVCLWVVGRKQEGLGAIATPLRALTPHQPTNPPRAVRLHRHGLQRRTPPLVVHLHPQGPPRGHAPQHRLQDPGQLRRLGLRRQRVRACVPACLRACVPACLRACVPACLRVPLVV